MVAIADMLDRMLDPVGVALTPDAARRLVAIKADPEMQQRVDDLAERCNEGTASTDERSEYEALVAAATVVGVLQAKARRLLSAIPSTSK